MPNVNFYLRKPNPATGNSLIYLQFKYRNKRLVYTFNETIEPDNWNKKKQRVKISGTTTSDGSHHLNDLLDNLEKVCAHTYHKALASGVPTPDEIRNSLNEFMNRNNGKEPVVIKVPSLFNLIDRFISGEIKFFGQEKKHNTLKGYKTSKHSLLTFEKKERYPVNYDTITLDFFYKYVKFLTTSGLAHNTIAKRVKTLKVFMNEAVALGYTTNLQFKQKKFSIPEREVDSVYLTEKEIVKLYRHDFSLSKRLEQVRDMFVFGCCVGLRFSDYSNIKPENIVTLDDGELYLQVKTIKTGELVIIPCNPLVLEIFKKYEHATNNLPKAISGVKFNLYLKEACQLAGLTEKGCLLDSPEREKWEFVTTHTARRSFATNLYLQRFPIIELMKVTGHRSQSAFLRYIRITKLDTAILLKEHIKKTWSTSSLAKATKSEGDANSMAS